MNTNCLISFRPSPRPALDAPDRGLGGFGLFCLAACAWLGLAAQPALADEVAIPAADGKILGWVSVESVNLDRVEAAIAPDGRAAAVSLRHGRFGGATLSILEPGRPAQVLLEAGADEVLSDPIWSRDGALIAVVVRGPARRRPPGHALHQGGAVWLCTRFGACARASLAEDFWRPAAFLKDGSLLVARSLPGDLIDLAPARVDPISGGALDLPQTPQTMDLVTPPQLFPPLPAPGVDLEPATRQALSMPYVHQVYDTPNDFNGHWACGPTSTLMAVLHFNRLDPWPVTVSVPYSHNSDFGAYVAYAYTAYGSTFNRVQNDASGHPAKGAYGWCTEDGAAWAWRMQDYAERHDLDTTFDGQATFSEIQSALNAGKVVALSTRLTNAGHIITVKGTTADGKLVTNDPYGNKNQGYMNYNGEGAVYTWAQVSAKWFITVHGSGAVTKGTAIGAVYVDRGDDDMDERIVGATVSVEGGPSTTSREGDGIWSFELAPADYTIRASAVGFEPTSRSCTVQAGTQTWCSIGLAAACEPDCEGRQCGGDGCGGSCGECPDHHTCSDGQCECQPDCTDLACGPDPNCGELCGDCPDGLACQAGACACAPACDGRRCGDDGCGGTCGECAPDQQCDDQGQCQAGGCELTCGGRECGPDTSCGKSCGVCADDQVCDADGLCQAIPAGEAKLYGFVLASGGSAELDPDAMPHLGGATVYVSGQDPLAADENGAFEVLVAPGNVTLAAIKSGYLESRAECEAVEGASTACNIGLSLDPTADLDQDPDPVIHGGCATAGGGAGGAAIALLGLLWLLRRRRSAIRARFGA